MIAKLDHINISVVDFKETVSWYERVFGFQVVEQGVLRNKPWGVIRAGDALLCIYQSSVEPQRSDCDFEIRGLNHFALTVASREEWEQVVFEQQIKIEYDGSVEYPHSTSWYVNDPSGYEIEVVAWHDGQPKFG